MPSTTVGPASLRAAVFTVNVAGAAAAIRTFTDLASGRALGAWGIRQDVPSHRIWSEGNTLMTWDDQIQ